MGPNHAELVRVFVRKAGAVIAGATFPSTVAFEAAIDCEAGIAIFGTGAQYELKIDVTDFSAMVSIITGAIVASGSLGDACWPTHARQFVFSIPAPGVDNEGHIWRVFASLKVGVVNPDASLAKSALFLIAAP